MDDEQEIDLDQITDENLLQSLLDQTDDPEDRKVIRDRIKELRASKKNEREEKMTKLTNTREDMLQTKKKEAEQHKQRTMAMYDNMAKSAPAGEQKKLDTNILKPTSPTPKAAPATPSYKILGNAPTAIGQKADLVEDAIKKRAREAEERKKRILAAFDVAAKASPAGAPKDVDLDAANSINIEEYERHKTQESGSTFQMAGGVPIVKRTISIPGNSKKMNDDSGMDVMERALRERQRECEERKRQILEKYSNISKQQAGPKIFV